MRDELFIRLQLSALCTYARMRCTDTPLSPVEALVAQKQIYFRHPITHHPVQY